MRWSTTNFGVKYEPVAFRSPEEEWKYGVPAGTRVSALFSLGTQAPVESTVRSLSASESDDSSKPS